MEGAMEDLIIEKGVGHMEGKVIILQVVPERRPVMSDLVLNIYKFKNLKCSLRLFPCKKWLSIINQKIVELLSKIKSMMSHTSCQNIQLDRCPSSSMLAKI